MFGIGKSAEERQREKERKKRGARKYGQANYKHSRKGVVSCISSIGGLVILAGCIFYAFFGKRKCEWDHRRARRPFAGTVH